VQTVAKFNIVACDYYALMESSPSNG